MRYEQETISNIFCDISRRVIRNKYPFIKLLLNYIEPTMMASYLYLGAGIGIGIVFLITKSKDKETYEKITKKDLPNVLGMIALDIAAPILLMFGLLDSASSNASLLNNFEIV